MARRRRAGRGRGGSFFLEVLGALCILVAVLLPLLDTFGSGVRQTHTIKTYTTAHAVAEYALSLAKAEVSLGLGLPSDASAPPADADLTADVRRDFPGSAAQLKELRVTCVLRRASPTGKLWTVQVKVSWKDPYVNDERTVEVQTIQRAEV